MSLTLKYRWLAVSCRELNSAELCSLDPWIKRLQKERGSISKAWSYPGGRLLPQVPVTRVQYAHTYTRTHTHTQTHTLTLRLPEARAKNTDDRSRCDEVFDPCIFSLSCPFYCLFANAWVPRY